MLMTTTDEINSLLNDARSKLLEYLFDENEKRINRWINNKSITTNEKWDFMLSYPNNFNKFKNTKIKRTEIQETIIRLLDDNICRIIHPGLIILCYDQLSSHIIFHQVYKNFSDPLYLTITNGIQLKKLRPQIITTFEIYCQLLLDNKLKRFFDTYDSDELLNEIKTKLFFNFEIEKMINMDLNMSESCNVRFNDICLNLTLSDVIYYTNVDKKKVTKNRNLYDQKKLTELQIEYLPKIVIEINEGHHIPVIDNLRKLNIYQTTGKLSLDYSSVESIFMDFYKKILKEIAKVIYKNYSEDYGIIFYLCCVDDFNVRYASHFWKIYDKTVINNDGITINEVYKMMKLYGLKNKLTKEQIMEELDQNISFIEYNEEDFYNSYLSGLGFDQLVLLPPKKEFPKKITFISEYTKFREKTFSAIIEFMNNDDEETYIFKLINHINQMSQITENIIKPTLDFILSLLNKETIDKIEGKYNIKICSLLPILMPSKSKYDSIDKKALTNMINRKYSDIINKNVDPGKLSIEGVKILPLHIIKDLLENNI